MRGDVDPEVVRAIRARLREGCDRAMVAIRAALA